MKDFIRLNLYYSLKAIRSILSGYEPNSLERWCSDDQKYTPLDIIDDIDDPYYVVCRFKDGRHLPLPLVLDPDQSEYPLQKIILKFFKKYTDLLDDAVWDCETYIANREITLKKFQAF
ncbi:hypothetical protein V7D15_06945 [Thermoanaerobacter thermohydrosulfuricus]